MGIVEFLLKLATDPDFHAKFNVKDDGVKQQLIRESGLSWADQHLISGRDLTGMRIKVRAELDPASGGEKAAAYTIYAMPGTIYIPPPPPPTEGA